MSVLPQACAVSGRGDHKKSDEQSVHANSLNTCEWKTYASFLTPQAHDNRWNCVTRFAWLVTSVALIALVASSDHQWMVWHSASAARGNDAAVRFAGREMSLIGFVNLIWSAVFIIVAALSVWSVLKAALRRFRGPLMTAHA